MEILGQLLQKNCKKSIDCQPNTAELWLWDSLIDMFKKYLLILIVVDNIRHSKTEMLQQFIS